MRKPRSDSKLLNAPAEVQADLAEWLLGGLPFRAAKKKLEEEHEVTTTLSALSDFYHAVCVPELLSRRKAIAAAADEVVAMAEGTDWDSATVERLRQQTFELMLKPEVNPKDVATLFRLLLAHKTADLDSRKVAILEAKAKRLDEIEAKARKLKSDGGLTPETLALIEQQLKIL